MKEVTRRNFIKSAAVLGAATVSTRAPAVHAGEDNMIKIGLVGCGGRGRGAVINAFDADPNCKLVAVGDAFRNFADVTVEAFKEVYGDRVDVSPDAIFDGLDCYKHVIDLCDVVLLCEPPAFRQYSLRAAVEAGKQIFCEKPVATDAAGVRSVMESARMAKEKNLNLVGGLCWRYDQKFQGMVRRVHEGTIGDVSSVRVTYLTGAIWDRPRLEGDTEMKFQVRNWYNFNWLSGDYNVEQHVHSLDKALWIMKEQTPIAAYGLGGRMVRTEQPRFGNIYDEMAVVYEYPDGRTVYSFCRQQNNTFQEVDAWVYGTKGHANLWGTPRFSDYQGNILYEPKKEDNVWSQVDNGRFMEQVALLKAIRSGGDIYINNGDYMWKSTMIGILGRQACYTGNRITWDEMMSGPADMTPSALDWDVEPPVMPDDKGRYKIDLPGIGKAYHTIVR